MNKVLKKILFQRRKVLGVVLLLQIITLLTALITPYINGRFVDILVSSEEYKDVLSFSGVAFSISLLGILAGYIFRVIQLKLKNCISFDLNMKIIEHIQRIPIEKFEKYNSTYLNQRIRGDCEILTNFWISNFISAIMNIIILIAMSVLLCALNKSLFCVLLVFIPVYCMAYILLKQPLYSRGHDCTENSNMFVSKLNEMYERNREIKTDALFEQENNSVYIKFASYIYKVMRYNKLLFGFTSLDGTISLMFQIVVFLYGGKLVIQNNMTIGEFTMINSYFSMILETIKYYFELGQAYQVMKISKNRLQELLEIPVEINGRKLVSKVTKLEVKNVNYYFNDKRVYNKKLNFAINKSGIYGLVGKNGAGKTTLINILVGINNANIIGEVYINNLNTKDIDMYNLRQYNFSIMLQGINSIDITVEDYISKYITDAKINELKHDGKCKDIFFSKLFNLDNLMNKKICEVSSGERQMVQLFTKIYKNADVYIFDEPTSNVHPLLVEHIWVLMEYLKNAHKIVVIISHDKSIYNRFDSLIDLN
ncbi:MAG: ABC transporter transmembrane domain-containing protein [Coprococcus phoceensis]|uniref:ABC transporter transmembrane domain-containing protein n=1 Tax=Mediterraneibacter faecis TaxID=592978 RepID=UPI001EDF0386|nr:ABC transporter ATP-binding protein [Mediterraneibacter faecis]MCG4547162.1 ABC transporter ATP-binding protein/permease [Mediterraneibacter faecis]MDU4754430.1 ABC transporter ATP-binding protein [Lachnospiraceae bacterium]